MLGGGGGGGGHVIILVALIGAVATVLAALIGVFRRGGEK
jgi:hypothetical protein